MSGCPRLRLIFWRDWKLLLDPPDFLGCMSPEEALHVRRKFAQKVGYRIRAQRTAEAIHGVSESSVMSWVIAVFQRTANKAPRNSDVLNALSPLSFLVTTTLVAA